MSEPQEPGTERSEPAEKAFDEVCDELASNEHFSLAKEAAARMRDRWLATSDEVDRSETYWLVYLYRFEPDDEGWFLWTPVGLVEERETWQEWWKRVLEGEIELPELYQGEGWWCSDKPVSFGLYDGQQAGDRDE